MIPGLGWLVRSQIYYAPSKEQQARLLKTQRPQLISLAPCLLRRRRHSPRNRSDPQKLNPPCQRNLTERNT